MENTNKTDELNKEIARLKEELADAEKRIPAHSIRPHQMLELEEIEDTLFAKQEELKKIKDTNI